MGYTIFLLSAFPTPEIPPIAPDVINIKNLIRVDAPGADLNAAIPVMVNNKNKIKPHITPVIRPFFASFFAEEKPAKKLPPDIEIDEMILADDSGNTPNDINKANSTNKIAITTPPIIKPNITGFAIDSNEDEVLLNPVFIKKSSKEILLLNNISLEVELLLVLIIYRRCHREW